MKHTKTKLQQLSTAAINQAPEIRAWLSQFDAGQQQIAKMLLHHLRFVSRDAFSSWLRRAVGKLPKGELHALYSVRKLEQEQTAFWSLSGDPVARPGTSQGSEDLVYSLISGLVRSSNGLFLDHPSLLNLKEKKVRSYVLVDDSIGSGDRVSGFINAMLMHPTFLSWWSFGWVKIHVISFARPREAEAKIIDKVRGSSHGKRKLRKVDKIKFTSEIVYETDWYEARWGKEYKSIIDLCEQITDISRWECFGYGDVMANIVFHHSVPDNLPGMLWCSNENWRGLMPGRAVPNWLLELLKNPFPVNNGVTAWMPEELLRLLALIKRGLRSTKSLAIRLGIDHQYATGLINHAAELGFLTSQLRLTSAGLDRLIQSSRIATLPEWDRSLYIPSSWCAGQATVQPLTDESSVSQRLADSVDASASVDGDVGQASLERSDAKTATPSFSVTSHSPSMSRKRRDTDGPKGPKER